MSKLFESAKIGTMPLANRFVRSATWEGLATVDGAVTPELVEAIGALARGGVGLIISSHAYVRPDGQAGPRQLGAYKDELVPGLRRMATAARENGAKMVLQLAHAGCFAAEELTGATPLAVSAAVDPADPPGREVSATGIRDLVRAFADAARRAKAAGFDGVQIHSAHGYLLSQFLSPRFNRRTDAYGGDIRHRSRAPVEVIEAVRAVLGRDTPLLVKMNCRDLVEGGLELDDAIQAAVLLQEAGADAIEISSGLPRFSKFTAARPGIDSEEKEAYHQEEARAFKQRLKVPLILSAVSVVCGGRAAGERGRLRLHLHVPAFHPGAGPGEPLEVRRPCSRPPAPPTTSASGPSAKGGFYCVTADQGNRVHGPTGPESWASRFRPAFRSESP
jgi:2,4-dienoyl-CoA reductase-like NADH-dependent reductase (Old Yellow Enzyme family)